MTGETILRPFGERNILFCFAAQALCQIGRVFWIRFSALPGLSSRRLTSQSVSGLLFVCGSKDRAGEDRISGHTDDALADCGNRVSLAQRFGGLVWPLPRN